MSEPAPVMPRTLSEAKTLIVRLRQQLAGHGSPAGGKPVPGRVDTQPVGGNEPIPPPPQDPHPILPGRNPPINPENRFTLDLSALAPRQFADFIERCTAKDLKALLSRETGKGAKQDPAVVGKLYRELKRRGC